MSPTQGSAALDSNEVMLAWMRRECFVCQVLEVEVTKVCEVEGRRELIIKGLQEQWSWVRIPQREFLDILRFYQVFHFVLYLEIFVVLLIARLLIWKFSI